MDLTKFRQSDRPIQLIKEYKSIDFSLIREKYTDPGTTYAFDILDCKIISGYLTKLSCFRHLRDLQCSEDDEMDYPYYYDVKKCKQVLNFADICPNVDTGEPTPLMDWQKFILCQMFGWRNEIGNKRFGSVDISVARGQGKTYLMAIIACYSYLIETMGLNNQDLMVTSNITEQAKKIYGYISTMMNKITENPLFKKLAEKTEMVVQFNRVLQRKTNNRLLQLSAESGKFDSYHFLFAVFDEAGETNHSEVTGKITSGQVKIANSQFVQISTAYPDSSVPFKQEEDTLIRIMEQDDHVNGSQKLVLIWAQDDKDEINKPETWPKSNPLLLLSSEHDNLLSGLKQELEEKRLTGEEFNFINKNLNMWLDQKTNSYIGSDDWDATTNREPFDIKGRDVYIGFDASLTSDNTALAFEFPYKSGTHEIFYLKQHSFIPWKLLGSIEAKEKSDGIQYRKYAEQGYCSITNNERGLINLDQVYTWLLNYVEKNQLNVLFFGYDALRTNKFIQTLNDETDWPIMPIKQTSYVLTESIKGVQDGFYHRNIQHDDDQIMKKAFMNAVASENRAGMEVGKTKQSLKIDIVDAVIDAHKQGMYHFSDMRDRDDPLSKYSDDDIMKYLNSDEFSF